MSHRKLRYDVLIVCGSLVCLGLFASCSGDSPTGTPPGNSEPPGSGNIDPQGDADFLLGFSTVAGSPEDTIEVWGHDLSVDSQRAVSFNVVLINRGRSIVYPPLYFYVTPIDPSVAQVANASWPGFGGSSVFDLTAKMGGDTQLDPEESTEPARIEFELASTRSFAIAFDVTVGEPPIPIVCTYPTVIAQLPNDELLVLRDEFAADNPNACSSLDEFGFTAGVCGGTSDLPDDADTDSLIAEAKAEIVRNSRFTGVADGGALEETSHFLSYGRFRVFFGSQTFEGLPVIGTRFLVQMDTGGVTSIDGHYYADICVPERPFFSELQARESLIGFQIGWYDFGGGLQIYDVTEDALRNVAERVILERMDRGLITLSVSWRVPVAFGGGGPGWYVYVDTMTKDIVWIQQLFYTLD